MKEIILFLLSYVFVFIIYEIFVVSKAKNNRKSKKESKQPIEVKYLVNRYKFDLKKINYHRLLHVVAAVSAFDIAFIVSLSLLFDSYLLQMLIILVLVVPVILISYHLVYLFYSKKGLI